MMEGIDRRDDGLLMVEGHPFAPGFFPTSEWVVGRLAERLDPHIAERVLNIYVWGSRLYGCATPTSDWDCIVVTSYNTHEEMDLIKCDPNKMRASRPEATSSHPPGKRSITEFNASVYPVYQDDFLNATLIPLAEWSIMVREHRHMALEAIHAPPKFKLVENRSVDFTLDFDILRRTVLWESTRTFVAAGNKLLVPGGFTEKNFYRACKEVVHALRYLLFGIQLMKFGCITDYSAANSYLVDICQRLQDSPTEQSNSGGSSADDEHTTCYKITTTGQRQGARRENQDGLEPNVKLWNRVSSQYRPVFDRLRQELKDMRESSRLYGRYETEKMLRISCKERRKRDIRKNEDMDSQALNLPVSDIAEESEPSASSDSPLKTICYLLQHSGSLQQRLSVIAREHNVVSVRHTLHPNLVLLQTDVYSITEDVSTISRECKGLIVDAKHNFEVVAYPFPHVVDVSAHQEIPPSSELGEVNARWRSEGGLIAQEQIHVTECLDGLSAVLYFYAGEWHLSSNFEPDTPCTNITWKEKDCNIAFHQLFWDTWQRSKYQLPKEHDCCYTFELLSRKHRQLVSLPDSVDHDSLFLVAVRHTPTLQERNPQPIAERYGWLSVPFVQHFKGVQDIQTAVKQLNPMKCKGYVIVDTSSHLWRRWVIKSPQYVAVQLGTDFTTMGPLNLRAEMDDRHMRELIRYNKADEFLLYHPQWKDFALPLKAEYDELCYHLQEVWDSLLLTPDQKSFAQLCKQHGQYNFIFFKMRKEGSCVYSSVRQYLALADDSVFASVLQFWRQSHCGGT